MDFMTMPYFDFLVLLLPGFVAVLTYHKLAKLEMKFNARLFMVSFLSGLGILLLVELVLWKQSKIDQLLKNAYAAATILSIFAFEFGAGFAWLRLEESKFKAQKEFYKEITKK